MTAMLDPEIAHRLTKLLGMLGSAHDGERAAAGAKVDQLIRRSGLTWSELLQPGQIQEYLYQPNRSGKRNASSWSATSTTAREQIQIALANLDTLSGWERGFIYSVWRKDKLSAKQRNVLDQIVTKVRAGGVG